MSADRMREGIDKINLPFAVRLWFQQVIRIKIVEEKERQPTVGLKPRNVGCVQRCRAPEVIEIPCRLVIIARHIEAELIIHAGRECTCCT